MILGVRKNGEEFPADAAISKLVIDGKRILTVALRDITEQKQAETETGLLAELGTVSAGTLEFEDRLTNLARLLARDLADLCIVDVIDGRWQHPTGEGRQPGPDKEWLCDVFMQMPRDGERPRVAGSVLETGQAASLREDDAGRHRSGPRPRRTAARFRAPASNRPSSRLWWPWKSL